MPRLKLLKIILCLCVLSTLGGCASPPQPLRKLSEAEKKLIEICQNEYKLEIVLKPLNNTLWIYVPQREAFLDFKANDQGAQNSPEAKESLSIKFLEGKFIDGTFKLTYDIGTSKTYTKDYGFATQFNEQYQENQRNILTAIYRAFADLQITSKGSPQAEKTPDFFILVIADIIKGIETQTTFYFPDILRGMSDPSFNEEYTKRIIPDSPVGNKDIILDNRGDHLDIQELTWAEFLIKQIVYRIQYKYQRSSLPPSAETKNEILKIFKETVEAYQFKDFTAFELHDLDKGTIETFEKSKP